MFKNLIDALSKIMPTETYYVTLSEIYPTLAKPCGPRDFFTHMQTLTDPSQAHDPLTDYYVLDWEPKMLRKNFIHGFPSDDSRYFELIVPILSKELLCSKRVEFYQNKLQDGLMPTAVSISVLDIKISGDECAQTEDLVHDQWCYTHYLLDGHHKMYAAAQLQKPITLISFFAYKQGVGYSEITEKDVHTLLMCLNEDPMPQL